MKEEKTYLASADVAERAGCIDSSYRTKSGKFIISEKALRDFRFRMTAEEYVTGLDIEMLTPEEAVRLARENNYAIGKAGMEQNNQETEEEVTAPENGPQGEEDVDDEDTGGMSNLNDEEEE